MWLLSLSIGLATPTPVDSLGLAVRESKRFPVDVQDSLGEGDGCFDGDSRYEPTTVNCQIWLQWVLATAYAGGSEIQFRRNLDALRYYEGVSFAERKHFVDRWILYAPEPLQFLENKACRADQSQVVTLQLARFRALHQYSVPLFEEYSKGTEQHVVSYLSAERSHMCLNALPDGWYVGFFVANEAWLSRWSSIGELGLVHSMLIEKTDTGILVHHASMDSKKIMSEPWTHFQSRLSVVSKGYRFFSLDPEWHPLLELSKGTLACP